MSAELFRDGSRYRFAMEQDPTTGDFNIKYRGHEFTVTKEEAMRMTEKKRRAVIRAWANIIDRHKTITI